VPYITTAGELKTKPAQHSVKQLLEIGIQPDILLCRTDRFLSPDLKAKIALFCNVSTEAVITARDVECVYEVPLMLAREGMDEILLRCLNLPAGERRMEEWERLVERVRNPKDTVTIGLVGKYVEFEDSYKSLKEALVHGGLAHNLRVDLRWVEAEGVEGPDWMRQLEELDGILVPGGFGKRGVAGMIRAIEYARTRKVPYFGICLGMQTAVIEFARNACGLAGADSSEFDPATPHRVIYKLRELRGVDELGGTMRLGAWPCRLTVGSFAQQAYGAVEISERHRHRYEFNREYEETLVARGMRLTGTTPDNTYVEIVEVADHPWFLGCQFHPEFKSKPLSPHPLFRAFIGASYNHRRQRLGREAAEPVAAREETKSP
ncbi:MAG: CTP synthase, partial [Terriglobia bacterium]